MDAVTVPLPVIQLAAIGIFLIDTALLAFMIVYRLIEGVRNNRRAPELAAARRSMLQAVALGGQAPEHEDELIAQGKVSSRISMLAAAQLLNTIRGEAHVDLVGYLHRAGYADRAVAMLSSRNSLLRGVACELLGALGDASSSRRLIHLLRDPDEDVRNTAVRALGRLKDPRAVEDLIESLEGRRAISPVLVGAALVRIGPPGATALRNGLHSQEARTRALCARVLGLLDDFEAEHALIAVLNGDDQELPVIEAARALQRVGGKNARGALLECVQSRRDSEVRVAAISALSGLVDQESVRTLLALVADTDPRIARAAARALERSGPEGRIALSQLEVGSQAASYAAEVRAMGDLGRGSPGAADQ